MSVAIVRALNTAGIERFRAYLAALRTGAHDSPPRELLSDPACTDCSISEIVPSCELGKISTLILFDDSLAISSAKTTIAL